MKYLTEKADGGFATTFLFDPDAVPVGRYLAFPEVPDGEVVTEVDFSTGDVVTGPDNDPDHNLTRAEFNGMLAAKKLKPIWDAMRSALADVDTDEAEESRHQLEANLHARFYNLKATLDMVGQFRGFAASINADYADRLTDDNIKSAWRATVARRTA